MQIHFIAIGGSAMHNLALALHHKAYKITGSDDEIFEPSKSRLAKHNLLPEQFGWFPEKITTNLDAVILGMHAKPDNPELLKAQELGLKIYSYPEFIYEQSKYKTRVVIGGSHGKTTITSMILHVLHYHDKKVDFMVGAQLEGFDTMVHLTKENDFILLEGDEYLSSPMDRRPKFHWYQPNIALLSGIAWDHINVFPTFENYVEQFQLFVDSMTNGSTLVYNEEDEILNKIALEATKPTRKHAYSTPDFSIEDGTCYLETPEGPMPLEIFGKHNLQNLAGAKWICQHMGVDEEDFYEAIATFKGASKRLEKLTQTPKAIVYKDYAHSPSKVSATTKAVKTQFSNRNLIACLELHTYSSLNTDFLAEYKNALEAADEAVVFYSPKAIQIKQLEAIDEQQIFDAFNRKNLQVFTDPKAFQEFLKAKHFKNDVLLLMSSGNYGGLDFNEVKKWVQ
ncbi:UDP-N-acetylmuramate--L-alanine ligase [Psychroflexus salis]|uniref:Peptidoglycan synthetase n=1 Tax=Psychroflexus salis TaxID=1526574 RepID=A0A916ZQ61_9FLAO|nr:Mur ligase family protein [Psychroflexus salis]GGE08745.1 peptidoglycan synthetase [Psychroflexus salis]